MTVHVDAPVRHDDKRHVRDEERRIGVDDESHHQGVDERPAGATSARRSSSFSPRHVRAVACRREPRGRARGKWKSGLSVHMR